MERHPPQQLAGNIVGLVLAVLLLYVVFLGVSWARKLCIFLLSLGGVLSLGFAAAQVVNQKPSAASSLGSLESLFFGVSYIVFAVMLGVAPSIRAFLEHQRARRG